MLLFTALSPALPFELINGSAEEFSDLPDGLTFFNSDMAYEGDLIIDGNKSVVVENCSFDIKGRIIMSDSSTLILRNAIIRLIESEEGDRGEGLFWFNMSGDSSFQASNITIETILFQSFSIHISDRSEMVFDDVYSLEWYGLVCERNSKVQILNSVCWSMIETRDESTLFLRDSQIYGVNVTGESTAFLDGIQTTRVSVAESGSIKIYNSTIRSETDGLELIFAEGTKLTMKSFSTIFTGIEYEFCESWNLYRDNDVSFAHLNVIIERIYLKSIRFVLPEGTDINIHGLKNPYTSILCKSEDLEVMESTLNEITILNDCSLHLSYTEFDKLHTRENSSALIEDSKIGLVTCTDQSFSILSSSDVSSIACQCAAILQLINCSIPESTTVSENSVIFNAQHLISISRLSYDIERGMITGNIICSSMDEAPLDMVLNRDRIRDKRTLKIALDGEARSYNTAEEKDLETISILIPLGAWALSISMGPPPPERVPFFHTLAGQRLISLMIIIILVIAVLLAWR